MRQETFTFYMRDDKAEIIPFPPSIKTVLIEHMAEAILQTYRKQKEQKHGKKQPSC